jgi:hypothetical protein
MRHRRYDTPEGILTYLETLEGLHQLIRDRREAAYQRKEELTAYFIMGHWHTSSNGSFGRMKIENEHYVEQEAFAKSLAKVVLAEDFFKMLPGYTISTSMRDAGIPPAHMLCAECGQGWNIENAYEAHCDFGDAELVDTAPFVGKTIADIREAMRDQTDAYYFMTPDTMIQSDRLIDITPNQYGGVENRGGWMKSDKILDDYVIQEGDKAYFYAWRYKHRTCHALMLAREEQRYFREILAAAGLDKAVLVEIPNGYYSNSDGPVRPWFLARMHFGNIKIGWRKRVISIDWSDTKRELLHLFKSEDVTKEQHLIHAWSKAKAIEYLTKIREALISPPSQGTTSTRLQEMST